METPFALAGFEIDRLVGAGGGGEVWRAREQVTGDVVALKRVLPPTAVGAAESGSAVRRLRREAALLAGLRHRNLRRLRRVVPVPDGVVLVLDFAAGGSLAAVLAARGRLPAGELVSIAAPIAEALGYLHAAGLVHGDLSPANIVFDAAGTPLLADFGVARLAGEPPVDAGTPGFAGPAGSAGRAGPAGDVHGLAAVCYAALTGVPPYRDTATPRLPLAAAAPEVPAALAAVIESTLAPDPQARPAAAEFARLLCEACTAEPVRLPPPGMPLPDTTDPPTRVRVRAVASASEQPPEPAGPGGRTRRPRWVAAVIGAAAIAVAAVAVVVGGRLGGGRLGGGGHVAAAAAAPVTPLATSAASAAPVASAPGSADPSPASASGRGFDWTRVLTALDAARDQAFEDGDAAVLDGVYLPGSLAGAADRRVLGELIAAGAHARGLDLRLTSVLVRARAPDRVVLGVRDTLPGYEIVAADGAVRREPGRGARTWIVTLARAGGSWRIDTITAAPASGLP